MAYRIDSGTFILSGNTYNAPVPAHQRGRDINSSASAIRRRTGLDVDQLIQRLLEVAPHVYIGRGPEHPTHPNSTLAKRTATWLSVHPFLNQDAGYLEFLRRYSGVQVLIEKSLYWGLNIPGFTPRLGDDYRFGYGTGRLDPTVRHIDENGFYDFAEVFFELPGEEDESVWAREVFGFDASAKRRWGVYRSEEQVFEGTIGPLGPPEWFCETFLEWLRRVIDRVMDCRSKRRTFRPGYSVNDLPQPAKPVGPSTYGEKKRCPNCGSNHVRGMTRKETISFYGSNILVPSVPRKCRACGHEYEVIPSKGLCVMIMIFAAIGTLTGASWSVGSFVLGATEGGESLCWGVVIGLPGIALMGSSMVVYVRFRQYLRSKMAFDYYNRGIILLPQGDLEGAIADFTKAIELDPKDRLAYASRGFARFEKEDLDGVIADFSKVIDLDPQNGLAYSFRGSARGNKGNLAGAIADFTEAIDRDPKRADHYANRATAYRALGDKTRAASDERMVEQLRKGAAQSGL